jgi:uncharacterized membrane protein
MVIIVIIALFRVSRLLTDRVLARLGRGGTPPSADRILLTGFMVLLAGLLFLPFFTSILAFFSSRYLPGGMILHLAMVAVSVVLFSIAEDLFRVFTSSRPDTAWTRGRHLRTIALPLLVFWAIGFLFLSPVFYSGLAVILTIFYLYALICRPSGESHEEG